MADWALGLSGRKKGRSLVDLRLESGIRLFFLVLGRLGALYQTRVKILSFPVVETIVLLRSKREVRVFEGAWGFIFVLCLHTTQHALLVLLYTGR